MYGKIEISGSAEQPLIMTETSKIVMTIDYDNLCVMMIL